MNLRIHITIEDKNGHTAVHSVDVNVEMPEDGPMIIDHVEQELLRVNREVILTTISAYLEELSKKKARTAGGPDGGVVTANGRPYAVDGELG